MMKLVRSQVFFLVVFNAALVHVTVTQDLCQNVMQGSCQLQGIDDDDCGDGCVDLNSITQCRGIDSLTLNQSSMQEDDVCAGSYNGSGFINSVIPVGFYISQHIRFCRNATIKKLLINSLNPLRRPIMNSAIEFHIFKRFRSNSSLSSSVGDLFVLKTSFNVTLNYNEMLQVFEAIPINSDQARVSDGDYLGLTVRQDIGIARYILDLTRREGIHINISETTCTGFNSPVFEVTESDMPIFGTYTPLIMVEFMSLSAATSFSTSQPTTEDGSRSQPTMEGGSSSTNIEIGVSTDSQLTIINIAASIGAVVIVLIVAMVVMVSLCLGFYMVSKRRKDQRQMESYASNQFGSCISMSTYNSQYMGNQQFQHPEDKAVVTIINPAAERETFYEENHDYHEPFEMNAARALPHLPRPITPRPTTITNVHYGVPGGMGSTLPPEPTSPHYQDPDELASTPRIQRNRPTFKNPLYSTTGELDIALQQFQQGEEGLLPIYDTPVELELKNDGAASTPVLPSLMADIYRESEEEEQALGIHYSLPVSAGLQSNSQTFGDLGASPPGDDVAHPYHELEPNSEVMPTTGHHYHLLDSQLSGSLDDDIGGNRDSLLRSNVHHIVNEPGAYVPTADERERLFSNNTLSVDKFETWKKASCKAKKFFVKMEEFWVPSKDEKMLYQQLNQKKFREIMKEQLVFESHLGQGQFGSVQKAKWNCAGGTRDVAVKIMKPSALENAKIKFLQEGAILGQFFHSNVIKLFGLVTMNNPVMIVMEYMQLGDLLSYLLKNYRPSSAAPPHPKTLLSFCRQIACGMKYLSRMHFVHRDLAARNIFVSETLVCKVGDFGMSRNLLDEEYYISHGGVVPVKWTAPEGLNYKKYSTASDVYSYGMVLYEIWSLGEKPLKDIPQERVAIVTSHGYCQPPPPGTPRKIYNIMVQCWNPEHSKRPSFDEVFEFLNGCDDDLLNWSERDLEKMSSPYSRNVGALLEYGECLYKDLQNTYHGVTPDII